MSRRVMIVGCGRLGATIADALLERGDEVVVLDTDAENFRRLRPRPRLRMIVADGAEHEALRRAGVESVSAFVAATGLDTINAMAAQSAQTTFRIPSVVCRVNDQARRRMYEEFGLKTISSTDYLAGLAVEALDA